MPAMTGIELAARIRQMMPKLPVVVATAHAELSSRHDPRLRRLDKLAPILAPFTPVMALLRRNPINKAASG